MRVLVTRPEPGGKRTAERLAELGHDPVLMPLFETIVTATVDDLPPVGGIGGLIATSARAFAMFDTADVIESGLGDVPIHAVGPATAQAANEAGFRDVRDGGGTAQALSETLSEAWKSGLRDGKPTLLVYLAGKPRTPVIEAALQVENIDYSVVDCYQMNEISYSTDILKSDILSPPPDVVLLYSANAVRRFLALVNTKDLDKTLDLTRFVCLSAAIAGELPQNWQGRAAAAEHPDEDSLLASLAGLG